VSVYPFIARLLELRAPVTDGEQIPLDSVLNGPIVQIVKLTTERGTNRSKLEPVSSDEPIKIGLGVTPPAPLNLASPEYTDKARREKVQGTVLLSVRIEKDGHPSRVLVVRGLGLGLDEKAIESVSRSTFRPALKDGLPVVTEIQMEINFNLF
jgi:protein TonB